MVYGAFLLVALVASAPLPVHASNPDRHSVALWSGGDDGLTQRFFMSLSESVARSKRFTEASVGAKADFQIFLESHVKPLRRDRFRYAVQLLRGFPEERKPIRRVTGTCREADMHRCADEVLKQFDRAAEA